MSVGDRGLVFEVKEIAEDNNFGAAADPAHPHTKSNFRTLGDHVRRRIQDSKKQIQYGAKQQGIPSVLLIYNALDPVFQLFGTEDLDFTTAMYGELTTLINKNTGTLSELFSGRNKMLQKNTNTSFSAVGRLSDRNGEMKVALFENVFAAVKIPFGQVPACFDIIRVNISDEPLVVS